MSYSKEEHGFQKFLKALKKESISNTIFIWGDERYLVDWAVKSLSDKYVEKAVETMDKSYFNEDTFELSKIKEACETFPFMSEKKVVIIELGFKNKKNKNISSKVSKADIDELIDYTKKIPETTLLVLVGEFFKSYKTKASKISDIQEFELNHLYDKDFKTFIKKRLKESGKVISSSVLNKIVENSGYFHKESNYNLYDLENDISKIESFSREEEITLADVVSVMSGSLEVHIFALIESISLGKKNQAFILLQDILQRDDGIYRVLAMIISQFETMLKIKEMIEDGYSLVEMKKLLKIHEYRFKRISTASSKYTIDKIKKILGKAYDIDKNVKTGFLEQNLALEMFIASV